MFGALLLAGIGCAHQGERTVADYIVAVAGVVKDGDGQPVEGVQVTFEVSNTLYDAITPVRRQALVTDAAGRFMMNMLISHQPSNPYRLRFEKTGFVTQTITGVAPPHQEHAVTLVPAIRE
jgi:hypothetical protein